MANERQEAPTNTMDVRRYGQTCERACACVRRGREREGRGAGSQRYAVTGLKDSPPVPSSPSSSLSDELSPASPAQRASPSDAESSPYESILIGGTRLVLVAVEVLLLSAPTKFKSPSSSLAFSPSAICRMRCSAPVPPPPHEPKCPA